MNRLVRRAARWSARSRNSHKEGARGLRRPAGNAQDTASQAIIDSRVLGAKFLQHGVGAAALAAGCGNNGNDLAHFLNVFIGDTPLGIKINVIHEI